MNKNPSLCKALPVVKEVLLENNIPFEIKNNGYHIIIRTGSHRYDFWPTSGKWMIDSDFKVKTGGLNKLLEKIFKSPVKNDDPLDKIFSKDIDDMTTGELKDTITLLCDFINKNIKRG